MTIPVIALLLVFFITSCNGDSETTESSAAPAFDLAAAKTEIIAANDEFETLFAAMDSVGMASLYAQGAKLMITGMPALSGEANIKSAFAGLMNSGVTKLDLKTIEVWGQDDLVTEEGEYTLYAGDTELDKGKYLVLWKKEDGKWHLFRDIFNSDRAAE